MSEYATLPTNLVDDELAPSNERRRYRMIDNGDGTHSFEEVTTYTTVGSNYGASQINAQNEVINQLSEDLTNLREEMGTMGLPLLDYANPLHTFDSSHLSYTVPSNVNECYLIANSYNGGYSSLTINGTVIGNGTVGNYNSLNTLGMIRLTAGDVVTMNTVLSSPAHIFGVRSVSN